MTENNAQLPISNNNDKKKKVKACWGINPLMPFLPQHVALAISQNKKASAIIPETST